MTTRKYLAELIGNDSYAATFQSLGQYRQALLNEIAQASAAPEQEAAREFAEVEIFMDGGIKCFRFDEYCHAYSFPVGTHYLYTHPSAEIERLRAENTRLDKENCDVRLALKGAREGWDAALDQRDELQQHLAEAQAIMGRVLVKEWLSPNCPLHKRIDAFLSATAQPAEVKS